VCFLLRVWQTIDDECFIPNGDDVKLANKLCKVFESHEYFSSDARARRAQQFSLAHYAGEVEYTTVGFVEKNRDCLMPEAEELLKSSNIPFVATLFGADGAAATARLATQGEGDAPSASGRRRGSASGSSGSAAASRPANAGGVAGWFGAGSAGGGGGAAGRKSRRSTLVTETLSQQFKEQLESLMGSISVTNPRCETAQSDSSRGLRGSSLAVSSSSIPLCITPLISQLDAVSPVVGSFRGRTLHSYVRCLKPNDSNCADLLEPRRLVEQLRYCGVLEVLQYMMNCEHAA
jgi:myosin heavy subunit